MTLPDCLLKPGGERQELQVGDYVTWDSSKLSDSPTKIGKITKITQGVMGEVTLTPETMGKDTLHKVKGRHGSLKLAAIWCTKVDRDYYQKLQALYADNLSLIKNLLGRSQEFPQEDPNGN